MNLRHDRACDECGLDEPPYPPREPLGDQAYEEVTDAEPGTAISYAPSTMLSRGSHTQPEKSAYSAIGSL